ncbi:hypothetical protein ACHAP7_005753 [Fusarium lateritium]
MLLTRPSEHIKRFHSPLFWCKVCFFKFNSSLSDKNLKLVKADHAKHCKDFTPKRLDMWVQTYVMDEEQYDRFKRWKQTEVPYEFNSYGGKESIPQRSWRQIRETIFPASQEIQASVLSIPSTSSQVNDGIQSVINLTERRSSDFRQRTISEFRSPAMDAPTRADLPPIPVSLTTADDNSWFSTPFSKMTDLQTWPSTLMDSSTGVGAQEDAQEDAYSCGDTYGHGFGEAAEQGESSSRPAPDISQGQPFSNSLKGAGHWDSRK